jgi:hypothetical protein
MEKFVKIDLKEGIMEIPFEIQREEQQSKQNMPA